MIALNAAEVFTRGDCPRGPYDAGPALREEMEVSVVREPSSGFPIPFFFPCHFILKRQHSLENNNVWVDTLDVFLHPPRMPRVFFSTRTLLISL